MFFCHFQSSAPLGGTLRNSDQVVVFFVDKNYVRCLSRGLLFGRRVFNEFHHEMHYLRDFGQQRAEVVAQVPLHLGVRLLQPLPLAR